MGFYTRVFKSRLMRAVFLFYGKNLNNRIGLLGDWFILSKGVWWMPWYKAAMKDAA
jgi:hypothetical protein